MLPFQTSQGKAAVLFFVHLCMYLCDSSDVCSFATATEGARELLREAGMMMELGRVGDS